MMSALRLSALLIFIFGVAARADELQFNRDIRPILADKCYQCHGPDSNARQAGLRLDLRDHATKPSESGATAIVPGDLEKSELLLRINAADGDERMPPAETGKSLTVVEREKLRQWIAAGATYQQHWSFVSPKRPELPQIKRTDWPRNPIDHFILARLEAEGLQPSAEAGKESLIRRVTLDLTGLPPAIKEIDDFLADSSPKAYEKVVDRLLRSPHYGEQMARRWLDAARYADTNGYQYDREREQWVWRDWVIWAYNENMPFDQFTIQQLAGDLLPNATPLQQLATGFNRNHPITIEGGVIDEEYRTEYVIDRVITNGAVWMGMTLLCSRCHDHKFDPISQKEFYQLFAFFNQVPERGLNGFDPKIKVASPLAAVTNIDEEISAANQQFERLAKAIAPAAENWEREISNSQGEWQIAVPKEMKSTGGATLEVLDDQSVLAGGKKPVTETYELVIETVMPEIRSIRLEAIRHESLSFGSASRGSNGNFVLSEFTVDASPIGKPKSDQRVTFSSASADHSQKGYEIAKAIDGKEDQNGWAVDGHVRRENRTATFLTQQPISNANGSRLRIRMVHNYGLSHQIGRFRISLSSHAPLPTDIAEILKTGAQNRGQDQQRRLREFYVDQHGSDETRAALNRVRHLQTEKEKANRFPPTMVLQDMSTARATHVLYRGQYDQKREQVEPGVPAIFPSLPVDEKPNRLAFARWLVDPHHPLTARVAVNRYWQNFFGSGIVKTVEDFGTQGDWPSHPELLDWLATEFVDSGWNAKEMQKLIVISAAYRQTSRTTADLIRRDPLNRLISRGPRRRLDAEAVRDNALAISGLLVDKIGGPSVYPYHPPGLWLEINNRPGYSRKYEQQTGENLYRRSMYTFWKRTVPPPSMATFDAPEREFCVMQRSVTNTPLQAFILLHDPQFVEAARHLAKRIMSEGGDTTDKRISYGFRLATARLPQESEAAVLRRIYNSRLARYQANPSEADKLLSVGESARDIRRNSTEHAAWTTVARVILNLSEIITKE